MKETLMKPNLLDVAGVADYMNINQRQVRRMIEYVRSVYDHKMEKLDDLLKFAASSPGGQRALRTSGGQRVSLSSNRLTRRTLLPRRAWR